MPTVTIGVDSAINSVLILTSVSPQDSDWVTAMPGQIAGNDSGAGKLEMADPSLATFTYVATGVAGPFAFIVTYDHNGLVGQGAAPAGYHVSVRLWQNDHDIIFDVEQNE
jgi:hypothetical protein